MGQNLLVQPFAIFIVKNVSLLELLFDSSVPMYL